MGQTPSQPSLAIYPSTQYLLPIFGHPFDVAAVRLMGDMSVTDTNVFGLHFITPAFKPISAKVANKELWERFGHVDYDVERFKTLIETKTSPIPTTYSQLGTGPVNTNPEDDIDYMHGLVQGWFLEKAQGLENKTKLDPLGLHQEHMDEILTSHAGRGLPYWNLRRPVGSDLQKIHARAGEDAPKEYFPSVLSPALNPAALQAALLQNDNNQHDNDLKSTLQPIRPNVRLFREPLPFYYGRLTFWAPTLATLFHRSAPESPIVTMKRVELDPISYPGVIIGGGGDRTNGRSHGSGNSLAGEKVPFFKITLVNPLPYRNIPLIHYINLKYVSEFRDLLPSCTWHEKFQYHYLASDPIGDKIQLLESETESRGIDDSKQQRRQSRRQEPQPQWESSQQRSKLSSFTFPSPKLISIRPSFGFQTALLGLGELVQRGQRKIEPPICQIRREHESMPEDIPYPFHAQLVPVVKSLTQYFGTILVVDTHHESGPEVLGEFIQQTAERARIREANLQKNRMAQEEANNNKDGMACVVDEEEGQPQQETQDMTASLSSPPIASTTMKTTTDIPFDIYHSPVYLITITKSSSLDTQLITHSTILHTLSDAGFSEIHSIVIEPSLTRCVATSHPSTATLPFSNTPPKTTYSNAPYDPTNKECEFLGYLMHNGSQAFCEPLMTKIKWDQFVAPIFTRLWQLEFGSAGKDVTGGDEKK